ncbi:MAG: PorT family protein [Bacteroidales bacterium]|jgi:hypothetical protein|nr:PorT family protein [Bacteroidales bacterium]
MKRLLLFFAAIVIAGTLCAQQKKVMRNPEYDLKTIHMGFTLGVHSTNYRIIPSPMLLAPFFNDSVQHLEAIPGVGFHLSFITDLRLSEHFNLRTLPGLLFGQRTLRYTMRNVYDTNPDGSMRTYIYNMNISSIYVDVPILLKYNAKRINNYRPYLIGGGSIKYDLETLRTRRGNNEYTIAQNPLDFFYEFGFGINWYFVYFKFSTELKFEFGTRNIIKPENTEYAAVIDKLYSRLFVLSFHFE